MPFTKYVKLPGSERQPVPGSTKTGAVDPNAILRVTLTLRARKISGKQPTLDALIGSGQRVTREEYAARYGADPSDVQKVGSFATAHKLAIAQVGLPARSVVLTGRTADFAKAFQVELACYEHDGGSYRGRTGMISVPSRMGKSERVVAVEGRGGGSDAGSDTDAKTNTNTNSETHAAT